MSTAPRLLGGRGVLGVAFALLGGCADQSANPLAAADAARCAECSAGNLESFPAVMVSGMPDSIASRLAVHRDIRCIHAIDGGESPNDVIVIRGVR